MEDSDSDASFQGTKRPALSAKNKYNPEDHSDSDSDDSLLNAYRQTFRTSKRLRKIDTKKTESYLEDALKSRGKRMDNHITLHRKIQQTKQGSGLLDSLLDSARALKVKREAENKEREKEKKEQLELDEALQQQSSSTDGISHRTANRSRPNDLWLEVRDTELTRSMETQFGLRHIPRHRNLPDSTRSALEYLEHVLTQETEFGRTKIGQSLKLQLKHDTLGDFLVHKRLCQSEVAALPRNLLRWMLEVAVATCNGDETDEQVEDAAFAQLSRGAYETLRQLWSMAQGLPTEGCVLSIADLPLQLQDWFGIEYNDAGIGVPAKVGPTSPTSVAGLPVPSTMPKALSALSLVRFLHLWELALSQSVVLVDNHQNELEDGIVALLLVSLDPHVFESPTETLASRQPSATLRKIVGHLLFFLSHNAKPKDGLATKIINLIGTTKLDAKSTDDDKARERVWSDQARIVRVLCHAPWSGSTVATVCERLVSHVVSCLQPTATYWNATIRKELGALQGWSTFATISGVFFQLVDYLPNQGATDVPASLVEFLLEALIMALAHLDIGVRGAISTLDTASKYAFFHLLDTVMVELTTKSKGLTGGNPEYLKVHYHTSCVRQYTRLETFKYKITEHQSTLDGYFSKSN